MQLYVARHGETELNAQQRYQGSSDWPLNEAGLAQAEALAGVLPQAITHLIASPLRRAQQTALAVSRARGLMIDTVDEFRERDYGAFEALNREEAIARFPDLYARRIAQQWDEGPPGGETVRMAVARVERGLIQLQARFAGTDAKVLLVAHGFVARAVDWLANGHDHAAFYTSPMLGNAQFQVYSPLVLLGSAARPGESPISPQDLR